MMPPHIFGARNFAVGNLATVFLYAGVSLGTLIVTLFLQETAGLPAAQAGLATLSLPVLSFFLAPRFGALAGRHGPRWYMACGPLIAAVGYLLMAGAQQCDRAGGRADRDRVHLGHHQRRHRCRGLPSGCAGHYRAVRGGRGDLCGRHPESQARPGGGAARRQCEL
jgi:MFS family permease